MNILSRLRLRTKLSLLLGLFVLALVVSIGAAASLIHQRLLDDRVDKLRAITEQAVSIVNAQKPLAIRLRRGRLGGG